jgi:hypothetical protein
MNADQAHELLRTVAEHMHKNAHLVYGIKNAEKAREAIAEALMVDKASREANQK